MFRLEKIGLDGALFTSLILETIRMSALQRALQVIHRNLESTVPISEFTECEIVWNIFPSFDAYQHLAVIFRQGFHPLLIYRGNYYNPPLSIRDSTSDIIHG